MHLLGCRVGPAANAKRGAAFGGELGLHRRQLGGLQMVRLPAQQVAHYRLQQNRGGGHRQGNQHREPVVGRPLGPSVAQQAQRVEPRRQ